MNIFVVFKFIAVRTINSFQICKESIKWRTTLRIFYIFNALGLLIFKHVYYVSSVPFFSFIYSNCIQVDADLVLFFYDPHKLCFKNLTEVLNC